jgi:dTDP-glucose 4,6-dehydratase
MRLNDGRALPAFMSQALRGEDVTVFGDGSQTRSFCFVSDLVDGIYRLMTSSVTDPVNIGNPAELSMLDFAKKVVPVDDPKVRQPDITRARTQLGWEPKVGLDEGLRKTLPDFARRLQEQAGR